MRNYTPRHTFAQDFATTTALPPAQPTFRRCSRLGFISGTPPACRSPFTYYTCHLPRYILLPLKLYVAFYHSFICLDNITTTCRRFSRFATSSSRRCRAPRPEYLPAGPRARLATCTVSPTCIFLDYRPFTEQRPYIPCLHAHGL